MNAQDFSGLLICLLSAACIAVVLVDYKKVFSSQPGSDEHKKRMFRNAAVLILLWVLLLGVLSVNGVFAKAGLPPRPMLVVLFALTVLLALSSRPH